MKLTTVGSGWASPRTMPDATDRAPIPDGSASVVILENVEGGGGERPFAPPEFASCVKPPHRRLFLEHTDDLDQRESKISLKLPNSHTGRYINAAHA